MQLQQFFIIFFLNKASEPAHFLSSILGAENQAPSSALIPLSTSPGALHTCDVCVPQCLRPVGIVRAYL